MTATPTSGRALPRGIRNHNPGNLRRSADPWQGLASEQTDKEFFQFTSGKWGIRALARTLIAYQDKVGLKNIKQMIGRWAPPNENDTGAYVRIVAGSVGVDPDQTINTHDYETLRPLALAIIRHENGQQPYTDAEIDAGLVLAGVEPPQRPLAQTRTVKGGQVAAGASHGIRFYGVVTLGNLLMIAASLMPILIWGIRLEGRVDMEGVLRGRLEKQVADQATDAGKRNDRIEALLAKINEDVTAVRIQLGTARRPSDPSAH